MLDSAFVQLHSEIIPTLLIAVLNRVWLKHILKGMYTSYINIDLTKIRLI